MIFDRYNLDKDNVILNRVFFSFAGAGVSVFACLAKAFLHQDHDDVNTIAVTSKLWLAFVEGAVAGLTLSVTFIGDTDTPVQE